MTWADTYIAALARGETVQFRPRGNSMAGKIDSGQLVTVAPAIALPKVGDVVLVRVRARVYLHLVLAVDAVRDTVQIGNNRGRINGWTKRSNVFGLVTGVQP